MNDCKYGHKIKGNLISLNLLRSPKTPDPEADMHEHTFTYALLPHQGSLYDARVIQQAYELNIPLKTIPAGKQQGQLPAQYSNFEINRENIIIEAVKQHEGGNGVIVRMYEAYGIDCEAHITFAEQYNEVWLIDLMEEQIEPLTIVNSAVTLQFDTFTMHTIMLLAR